jgi:hypothetical protein
MLNVFHDRKGASRRQAPARRVVRTSLYAAAALATTGMAPPAQSAGPSFDCSLATASLGRLICASTDLSSIDRGFSQAYYALRQQVGPSGWAALTQEDLGFVNSVSISCGLPADGTLPSDMQGAAMCVAGLYERQRDAWMSRLTGAAASEANRPPGTHIALQQRLQDLGYLSSDAPIDGVYGAATRGAIMAWQSHAGLAQTGLLGEQDAMRLADEAPLAQPAVATAMNSARPGYCPRVIDDSPVEITTAAHTDCYAVFVAAGKSPVFTLRRTGGVMSAGMAIYQFPGNELVGRAEASGRGPGLITISSQEADRMLIVRVTGPHIEPASFALYIHDIDIPQLIAASFGQALRETIVTAVFEGPTGADREQDPEKKAEDEAEASRLAILAIDQLENKDLSGMAEDQVLGEAQRRIVGDSFVASWITDGLVAYLKEVYKYS